MPLFDLSDGIKKGKGLDALDDSKKGRDRAIVLFGGKNNLPSSVMKAERAKPDPEMDLHQSKRGYANSSPIAKRMKKENAKRKLSAADLRSFSVSCQGCGSGALSKFPQNIGHTITTLYCPKGGTVFDPFAGHNSRMELCVKAGFNYIGCDLSKDFMRSNRERRRQLLGSYPNCHIKLIEGDSRKIKLDNGIGDFTITSPPYWDIEYYGDENEQLGKAKSYREFMDDMQLVMNENFRILKPGSYAVWFINDFRKKGKMYFYHVDIMKIAKKSGFICHDILITDFGPGIRDCFINQVISQKILPKRHEYGIVLRKKEKNHKKKSKK